MNIENAYTGYSTRKVIMEERNLYCGSYNVLVLVNEWVTTPLRKPFYLHCI